jgi:hypothetical protein
VIYYFLPGEGIYGGVKVACQFTELLGSLGVPATIVTPGGAAPSWFRSTAPVLADADALARLTAADVKMITWPPDYRRLRAYPGRLVCHCQGTDPLMDEIFADAAVPILSCWSQAAAYVREGFGRATIDVGIAISDAFFYDGSPKDDLRVAYMPRRGFDTVQRCLRAVPDVDFTPIDGLAEDAVAERLKAAGIFLATAAGEWFGLPALEALAAGCVVLSVPVKGGMEYLHHDRNALVVAPAEMPAALEAITRPAARDRRTVLRSRAIATASTYRRAVQRRHLAAMVRTSAWRQAVA